MNSTRLVIIAILALPAVAHSANWVSIGGNDEVTVYVDTESMRRTGVTARTWLKWQWTKPQEVPGRYPAKTYLFEKQLQISNCKEGTLAVAQGIRYVDLDGNEVVDSYALEEKSWKFSEAAPETIGESLVKFACKSNEPRRK